MGMKKLPMPRDWDIKRWLDTKRRTTEPHPVPRRGGGVGPGGGQGEGPPPPSLRFGGVWALRLGASPAALLSAFEPTPPLAVTWGRSPLYRAALGLWVPGL
jgi:hypothetical protein